MSFTTLVKHNPFGSFASATAGDRTQFENSITENIWWYTRADPIIQFDNPTADVITVKQPHYYTTTNNLYNGPVDWEEPITVGGLNAFAVPAGEVVNATIATQPPDGSIVFCYVGVNVAAAATYLRTSWESRAWEAAADAVSLPDRSSTGYGGMAATAGPKYVYAPCIVYGTAVGGEKPIIQGRGDSNEQGDGNSVNHWGVSRVVADDLDCSVIWSAVSGSNWNGFMTDRAARLARHQLAESMVGGDTGTARQMLVYYNTNDYVGMVSNGEVDDLFEFIRTSWAAIYADNPGLSLSLPTYHFRPGTTAEAEAARIYGNDLLRNGIADAWPGFTDSPDFAWASEDPADPTAYRPEIDSAYFQLHPEFIGFRVMASAIDTSLWPGFDNRIRPLVAPLFSVNEDASGVTRLDFNVFCNNFQTPELPKGFSGMEVAFSGGAATCIGGCVVEPETDARFLLRGVAYFDRDIVTGETFAASDIVIDGATTLVGADGRAAAINAFNDDPAFAENNSTQTAPGGGDNVATLTDRDFDTATHDDDVSEYYPASGAPAIAAGKLNFAAGNSGYFNTYGFQNDEGGGLGRPGVRAYLTGWESNNFQLLFGPAPFTGPRLQMGIADSAGKKFYVRASDFDVFYSPIIAGWNDANQNYIDVQFLPSEPGFRDRISVTVRDETAGVTRYSATVDIADATQAASRPDTNATYVFGIYSVAGGDVDRVIIYNRTADSTAPAFPANGVAYYDFGGCNVVIPITDDSQPLQPVPPDDITGFTGTRTVERAIVIAGKAVLLEIATADRRLATDPDTDTFSYAGGVGADKLADFNDNEADAAGPITILNNSIWDGESEVPPEEGGGSEGENPPGNPTIHPDGGEVIVGQVVSIFKDAADYGAAVHYTMNGKTPDANSPVYLLGQKPVLRRVGEIVFKARSISSGGVSDVITTTFDVVQVPASTPERYTDFGLRQTIQIGANGYTNKGVPIGTEASADTTVVGLTTDGVVGSHELLEGDNSVAFMRVDSISGGATLRAIFRGSERSLDAALMG